MTFMTVSGRRLGVLAAILIGAGVIGAAVAIWPADDDGSRQAIDESPLVDYLAAPNRTQLSLCVDGAGGAEATIEDVDRVRVALDAGLDSLAVLPVSLAARSVSHGCPPPLAPIGSVLGPADAHCCIPARNLESDELASMYSLFVYFVRDEVYAESFRDQPYVDTTAERICRGDTCEFRTGALYVPYGVEEAELIEALLHHFGLDARSAEPEPTIDWASCFDGTPNPWCKTINSCRDRRPDDLDCVEIE